MSRVLLLLLMLGIAFVPSARAQDAASGDDFYAEVDLSAFRALTIQHDQMLKTLDTYARQTMEQVHGSSSYAGYDPLFVLMHVAMDPQQFVDVPFIEVGNAALRRDLCEQPWLEPELAQQIRETGLVSRSFVDRPELLTFLDEQSQQASFKFDAVNELKFSVVTFDELAGRAPGFPAWRIIPPATNASEPSRWLEPHEFSAQMPAYMLQSYLPKYPERASEHAEAWAYDEVRPTLELLVNLKLAWNQADAEKVNGILATLTEALPALSDERYPSAAKRSTEIVYNRSANLTPIGASAYFLALVCFVAGARSGFSNLRVWGLRLMIGAFAIHVVAIAIRWWLVEKSTESWFYAIPIKNMFESVLFSAFIGAGIGLVLELRKNRGLFGAAASFVGFLSLAALFFTPMIDPRMSGDISQVQGVLMSYWLYIHVTVVVGSYGLITGSFGLSIWWLVRYVLDRRKLDDIKNPRQLSADAVREDAPVTAVPAGSGGAALQAGWLSTIQRVLFVPGTRVESREQARVDSDADATADDAPAMTKSAGFLAQLDQCNLVLLQMAFWLLGVGIIFGAVWADMSWGRPWGWDPKETFALVTWIVYLVVVHVRLSARNKALWTAILSIVGFFVMLFNWIGVNFFLSGLHSYA